MCFFQPTIETPDVPTPAPLPPPIDEEKVKGEVNFGGAQDSDKKIGKDSLKIAKKEKNQSTKPANVGVNTGLTPKKQAI